MPFIFFNFIPLVIMALVMNIIEEPNASFWYFLIFYICVLLFAIGTVSNAYDEVKEVINIGLWTYLDDNLNYF